jgi:hypothetical protein
LNINSYKVSRKTPQEWAGVGVKKMIDISHLGVKSDIREAITTLMELEAEVKSGFFE